MNSTTNNEDKNLNTYGPSTILNGGTISTLFISTPDRYDRYSLYYTMGVNNKTWVALRNIIQNILDTSNSGEMPQHFPWKLDEKDGLVHLKVSSAKQPPVLDSDKRRVKANNLSENMGVRINVKPSFYCHREKVLYRLPNGQQGENIVEKKGISVYLNGVLLNKGEEDEF